jgi:hypothetical protein
VKEAPTNWDELANELVGDRRRGKRLNLVFSIEVNGTDRAGATFTERTKTLDISESGCRIETALHLERGDIISIKLLVPGGNQPDIEPQYFRIMWVARKSVAGTSTLTVGARKLDGEKLWKVSFPPVKSAADPIKH